MRASKILFCRYDFMTYVYLAYILWGSAADLRRTAEYLILTKLKIRCVSWDRRQVGRYIRTVRSGKDSIWIQVFFMYINISSFYFSLQWWHSILTNVIRCFLWKRSLLFVILNLLAKILILINFLAIRTLMYFSCR